MVHSRGLSNHLTDPPPGHSPALRNRNTRPGLLGPRLTPAAWHTNPTQEAYSATDIEQDMHTLGSIPLTQIGLWTPELPLI
ncbi:hypothetical protein LIER_43658 [Lithospermum erythrorhizon]|uniref:Uncharacterized protein n=1 Tax=Lithospermum erythrorhizon TaxID=34254 RepID=A0AAV3QKR3_LITER